MKKVSSPTRDLALRCLALAEFLKDSPIFSERVRTSEHQDDPRYQWFDFGEREPEETFAVSRAGAVIRHTCSYSGHNGDSYGDTYEVLDASSAAAALQRLHDKLERRALAAEERRLAEAALRRRTEAAKRNLSARLRTKGLF